MDVHRRKNLVILTIVALFLIGFAFFVTVNIDFFNEKVLFSIKQYGFIGILFISFLADLFEQPIGPEIPASLGILIGLNFYLVLLFTILGSFCGSLINFYVGKIYLSNKVKTVCSTNKYFNYCKFFYKYGKWAMVLAATTPVPWVMFCWLGGSFNMKLKDFFIYGLFFRVLRILFFMSVIGIIFIW